ncbi:Rap1a/Tai family immunity protein [Viridibacterium curvum]|uniref:Rap1a immunity protein domain-containing protein n=1 Tax=Viridibacterium curvum TaxID=1101404 RepID=A0ABP9R848_9RHOO
MNLNGVDFLAAWTHTEPAIRERAQLYLLGVMDASEGRAWCSYSRAKSITLHELVFASLRKTSPARLQQRASLLIESALRSSLPCKVKT